MLAGFGTGAHPSATASVGDDFKLIGGGCRSEWAGAGQLLIDSYPSGNSWACRAKDHGDKDLAGLTAFAIGIPKKLDLEVAITPQSGSRGVGNYPGHSEATAQIKKGYTLVGGGCQDSWTESKPGHYLVKSFPVSDGWYCYSKDHNGADDQEVVTAYAIGIRSKTFQVVLGEPALSAKQAHPNSQSSLSDESAGVVGGGCEVSFSGAGNLLWADYPDVNKSAWVCASKDHAQPDSATVRAYSFGLKRTVQSSPSH